jgi:hypothetical protein
MFGAMNVWSTSFQTDEFSLYPGADPTTSQISTTGLFKQSDRLCRTTKSRIDPICENCVVRHFQMLYDTNFTNICRIV